MNAKTLERLKEAGEYQKMAVKALLPEYTHKHVEVIEGELKAIFWECIGETVKNKWEAETTNVMKSETENSQGNTAVKRQQTSGKKLKPINID